MPSNNIENIEVIALMDEEERKNFARKLGPSSLFTLFEALDQDGKIEFEQLHNNHLKTQPRWVRRMFSNNHGARRPKGKYHINRTAISHSIEQNQYITYLMAREQELVPEMLGGTWKNCIMTPIEKELGVICTPYYLNRSRLYTMPDFDPFTIPEVRPPPFDLLKHPRAGALYLAANCPMSSFNESGFCRLELSSFIRENSDIFPDTYSNYFWEDFCNQHLGPIFKEVVTSTIMGNISFQKWMLKKNPNRLSEIRQLAREEWYNEHRN